MKNSLVSEKFDWLQRKKIAVSSKELKRPRTDSPHVLVFNQNNTNQSVPDDICDYQHSKHHSEHSLGWIGQHNEFSFSLPLQFSPKRQYPTGIKFMLLEIKFQKENCDCNLQFPYFKLLEQTVTYGLKTWL